MSTTTDLLDGVIARLVAHAGATYREGAKYQATEIGIALNSMPADPDKMIVLTPYSPGGGDLMLTVDRLAFQMRTRGDTSPRTEMAIRDAGYEALHGLRQVQFGSTFLIALQAMSIAPMGRDTNGRWESVTHFYADIDRPVTDLRS